MKIFFRREITREVKLRIYSRDKTMQRSCISQAEMSIKYIPEYHNCTVPYYNCNNYYNI